MASIGQQVHNADSVICQNIANPVGDRGLLSQNVLQQLRNLVEGLIVWAHINDPTVAFHYDQVGPALDVVKATARYRLLGRFHRLLQASVSHYTLDGDPSERLMLKYYEYLLRTRELAKNEFGIEILTNLERFPIDRDPSLRDYYEKIATQVIAAEGQPPPSGSRRERYYIHSTRPFFVAGRIFYEITFSLAHDRTSKFDRIIGFTYTDMTDKYAAYLELANDEITVLGQTMPILIARAWDVAIRPCEFNNLARLFDLTIAVKSSHAEYRNLMTYLTTTHLSLLDVVDMTDAAYNKFRAWALASSKSGPMIFLVLDRARALIRANRPGSRLVRYLLLRMNNQVIKNQFGPEAAYYLSRLRVSRSCSPFDSMPFCTSPRHHIPRFQDLAESLDATNRKHELLARRIRNNVEQHGMIYTPASDLEHFGDLDALIATYNRALPPTPRHEPRKLLHENGHVFIKGYEDDTVTIIQQLQDIADEGVVGYRSGVQSWVMANPWAIDDESKANALEALFENSKVALIYGAAGTGKSTMVNHIANYFSNERKLFLAQTHPAVDNLRRRVGTTPNAEFSTIKSHVWNSSSFSPHYDVVVIDECSTVDNKSFLAVLEHTSFDLLVLVGDVYQIESIEFGNWFSILRSYIPSESVFELTKPFRTTDEALLTLWERVRSLDDRIEESLAQNGYSKVLGDSLFQRRTGEQIVLCLNYDGLYGINNVNRFMQASNPNSAVSWGDSIYKVGDPILFNETDRFRPVAFNNTKGVIVQIEREPGRITFDVALDHEVTEADVRGTDLRWVDGSTVRFDVFERGDTDEDNDTVNTVMPFQIAYAVSIHKAQGLEYDSVKVVITDSNEEYISHSIFYTAITRAREHLEVYWTPETQQRVLSRLAVRENMRDESLLRARRGVTPVATRPRRNKVRQQP